MWGILGTAIARCTIKSRHGLLTIRGVYRSPWCLADEFAFSHICPWSMVNCYLIVGDFNAPHINSMEFTTSGGCFVNSLLLTIIRCALVQSFVKSTQWLRTWTAIAGLVFTHHCDGRYWQLPPPPTCSDHVVLHLDFRTQYTVCICPAPPQYMRC